MVRNHLLAVALLLSGASIVAGRLNRDSPAADQTASAVAADAPQRYAYGAGTAQVGDLRLPAARTPAPVVMVLHGGCWQAAVASLDHTAPLAEALRRDGYATWNVEYRRLGESGGGWPGTFEDVGAALDYVRTLAARHPGRLDTTRVVVVGHSAGGHLASWLAIRPQLPADWQTYPTLTRVETASTAARRASTPLRPTGLVNLDGPPDLRAFEQAGGLLCGAGIGEQLLGGTALQHFDRWRLASPVSFLPWGVPCRLLVGSKGMLTPALSHAFEEHATAAGDTATALVELADIDHFALIDPKSRAWPAVRAAVRALVVPAD